MCVSTRVQHNWEHIDKSQTNHTDIMKTPNHLDLQYVIVHVLTSVVGVHPYAQLCTRLCARDWVQMYSTSSVCAWTDLIALLNSLSVLPPAPEPASWTQNSLSEAVLWNVLKD